MSRVLVASTLPAFAMSEPDWHWWLDNSEQIRKHAQDAGHTVDFFAALQIDARGFAPFEPIRHRLMISEAAHALPPFLTFSLDLGVDEWTTGTRLAGIVTGRNLIIDHAIRHGHEWIYFADSDIEAPDDILPRLLEVNWPVVGAHVPAYCLGENATPYAGAVLTIPDPKKDPDTGYGWDVRTIPEGIDVRRHWNTAGSLMVRRDVFRRVPWRVDPDAGETDDPATQAEMERLGYPTLVRHDVICKHHPDQVSGFEHRGLDRTVYR